MEHRGQWNWEDQARGYYENTSWGSGEVRGRLGERDVQKEKLYMSLARVVSGEREGLTERQTHKNWKRRESAEEEEGDRNAYLRETARF